MTNELPIKAPIDFKAIRICLVRALEKAVGLTVIMEEPKVPNAPRPALPYLSLKLTTSSKRLGYDEERRPSDTETNTCGPRKMVASIQCYSAKDDDPGNYLALLQSKLQQSQMHDALDLGGIAVWTIGDVADLSQLLNTGYEARAQMDVSFGIAANLIEKVGYIETVIVSGEVHAGTETLTPDFQVPET